MKTKLILAYVACQFLFNSCICSTGRSQNTASWTNHREKLVQGIREVSLPGSVGSLCIFGPKAFPLVTAAHEGTTRLPIIACANVGQGRVVACAHGGYVGKDHGDSSTAKLMLRLARWSSQKDKSIRFGVVRKRGIADMLKREGHQAIKLDGKQWNKKLDQIDLLVLGGDDLGPNDVVPVQQFITQGGGVIVGDAAWVWSGYRKKANETLAVEHMPNRLLAPIGIVWTRGMVNRDAAGGAEVQPQLPAELHALSAMISLEKDQLKKKDQRDQARVVIEQGFKAIPQNDKWLYPRIDRLSSQIGITALKAGLSQRRGLQDLKQRIAVGRQTVAALNAAKPSASPLASHFPGSVDKQAPRGVHVRMIDTSVPRWHSTALYAAPGETITVDVGSKAIGNQLRLRIGSHKDRLWHKPAWKRSPEITRTLSIDEATTEIANAFGGLIYVEVPRDCDLGEIELTVRDAVESPIYIHGKPDLDQWRSNRAKPSPWAEIGSDKIIFTVPSAKIRDLDRPDEVMKYWNEVMDACADLAMIDHHRESPERFVIDVQISAGYMHAGYPIMAPGNLADEVLDVETLRQKGNWGVFHEIGHNHQEPEWTYNGMGEVTVNLFSMYVYETLHPGAKQHGQVTQESINKKIAEFEKTQKREGPWVNLVPYIQLRREFGWDSFKSVFDEYRKVDKKERPKNDLEKRSQWMVRFSKQVGRNLAPFFAYWNIETSEESKQEIADLPEWNVKND